jgi:hypothetical protein
MSHSREHGRFYGTYRGIVFDNRDPSNLGRLRVTIPQLLGSTPTEWAWPKETSYLKPEKPPVGQGVWIAFEGGDPLFPVWIGTFGKNNQDNKPLYLKPLDNSEDISDVTDLLALNNSDREVDVTQTLLNIVRNRYYGSFYSTASQTAVLANSAYAVPLNVIDAANGISLVNGNTVRIEHNGVYNMAFSIQFASSNNSEHTVNIWLRHQGVDVPFSASRLLFKGHTIAAWNFFLTNDSEPQDWQLMWSCGSAGAVSISTIAASGPVPEIPGVIMTVNKVR